MTNKCLDNRMIDVIYENINNDNLDLFDIVILIGPNDKCILSEQIKYTKKNIIGYRNIYLICNDPTIIIDGCITIDEKIFPFSIETVRNFDKFKVSRCGWYLQQLLKLYALITIPEILDRCLIIDCDTFFLKPTTFIQNNKCLYNYGVQYGLQYIEQYFEHMSRLDKELICVDIDKSGITHHMMFEKKYINELINKIEKIHNEKFYDVFLKLVTNNMESGASEYEIYFNYILKNHPDKIELRKLQFENVSTLNLELDLDYISYHWYQRS